MMKASSGDGLGGATAADNLQQHVLEIARERDNAYQALQEREAELARIQRIGRVGGVEVDLRSGFRNRRSPEYLLIHGLPPEAAGESHQDWVNRIHPDDREATEKQFLTAVAGRDEDYTAEYRIIRPSDGELRWIGVVAKIERDASGRAIRLLGAHIDITAAKSAEMALRRLNETLEQRILERTAQLEASEARMRAILESSHQYQLLLGPEGSVVYANRTALAGIGARAADVIGKPYWDTPWFTGTDGAPEAIREGFVRVMRGESLQIDDLMLDLPIGSRFFDFTMRPVFDRSGKVTGAVPEAIDITQRRQSEEALRQSQKMEAIGQLTGGVAHDFNNLLTIIRSATDFLRRRDLPEERRRRYVDAISDTVERASKLTTQLLAFARRQPLNPEIFNVSDQVESFVQLIRPLVGSRIRVETDIAEPECFAMADVAQFETALINLAVNGRDAMEGEGRLTIAVRKVDSIPASRGESVRVGPFVAISVEDTGSGIAPENLAAIFEPFFTTKEVGKGTGLGLSQAFGFAKQSDGDVAVVSEFGKGATFTIYLPRAVPRAPTTQVDAIISETASSGRGHSVLVVDDNEEVGRFSAELLEDLGYLVRRVTNAREALALLAENEFAVDLVFSDVIMPGMNGVELAILLRERYPGLPVVLTSGYSNVLAENAHSGFELIQKPYSVELLSRILRKSLATKS